MVLRIPGIVTERAGPRSRSVVWGLIGLTALGLGLRFGSLGLQSYHHDEVITAMRVLPGSLGEMLHHVRISESTPPLYYLLAWVWSKAFGVGEVGLRSLSALFGTACVPIAYLIGRRALGSRTGLVLAAMVAVNPMLIWYSQEARSYALLVLLASVSFLLFLGALEGRDDRSLIAWALASGLALWSHYFAGFLVLAEAIVLVVALRGRLRSLLAPFGTVLVFGLPLLLILKAQIDPRHVAWIGGSPLPRRLWYSLVGFAVGETGHVIGEPTRPRLADVPFVISLLAVPFVLVFGVRAERRILALAAGIGLGVVVLAAAAALLGSDYVAERNLLPALVPLLLAIAAGFSVVDRYRLGLVAAAALCVWWSAFDVHVARTPALQRLDYRTVSQVLEAPVSTPRVIVTWRLGADPLRFYLDRSPRRVDGGRVKVAEIDLVRKVSARDDGLPLPAAFRPVGRLRVGRLEVLRYVAARPLVVPVGRLARLPTGFGVDAVLLERNLVVSLPPS